MRPVYGLGVFIPIAVVLRLADAAPSLVFATSALGIVPVAALMGEATEQLAARSGPGIGGLVNVTFGNAPELIIAIFALIEGLQEVVKASLVGSIVGNSLDRPRLQRHRPVSVLRRRIRGRGRRQRGRALGGRDC